MSLPISPPKMELEPQFSPSLKSTPPVPPSHDYLESAAAANADMPPPQLQTANPPQQMNFSLSGIIRKIAGIFRKTPRVLSSSPDLESSSTHDAAINIVDDQPQQTDNNPQQNFSLSGTILAFCFASMLSLLMLSFQIKEKLPLSVHFFALATRGAFTTIFLAKLIGLQSNLGNALKKFGQAFATVAFFVAVTVPSPLWLKILYWSIFLFALLAIFKHVSSSIREETLTG